MTTSMLYHVGHLLAHMDMKLLEGLFNMAEREQMVPMRTGIKNSGGKSPFA